ncbi:MAG: LVIVD repeat-containing protein, partial [Candidatus Kariarchaeaceae archaeon]
MFNKKGKLLMGFNLNLTNDFQERFGTKKPFISFFISMVIVGIIFVRVVLPISAHSYSLAFKGSYNTPSHAWDVVVVGNYAYIADSGALQIINIADPTNPTFVGSYSTPDSTRGLAVRGDYAYLADFSTGLLIINISDPTTPTYVGGYNTPGSAYDVAIAGNYAYVADAAIGGLQVINITTPSSPTFAGWYNTPTSATGVTIVDNYAYIADAQSGLQILNITDPTTPSFVGGYNTHYAIAVDVVGDRAYIADDSSVIALNVADPTSPTLLGSYDTPGTSWDVDVVGIYVFIGELGYLGPPPPDPINASLKWVDFTNPSSPTLIDSYNTTGGVRGVLVANSYVYLADGGNGLQILGGIPWVDTIAPTIDHPADVTYEAGPSGHTLTWIPTDTHPDSFLVDCDGAAIVGGPWNGDSITINIDNLVQGVYTYTVTVYDSTGNSASDSVNVTVTSSQDTLAPTIDHPADMTYEAGSS